MLFRTSSKTGLLPTSWALEWEISNEIDITQASTTNGLLILYPPLPSMPWTATLTQGRDIFVPSVLTSAVLHCSSISIPELSNDLTLHSWGIPLTWEHDQALLVPKLYVGPLAIKASKVSTSSSLICCVRWRVSLLLQSIPECGAGHD